LLQVRVAVSGLHPLGSGLSGRPDSVTVDCSALLSDIVVRFSAGETLAAMMSDLHYGILAELEECLDKVLNLVQLTVEETMDNSQQIIPDSSPEPMTSFPLLPEGVFYYRFRHHETR